MLFVVAWLNLDKLAGSFRRPSRKRRSVSPRPNAAYSHYRCQREFEALNKCRHMVSTQSSLCTYLRKKFGSQLCAKHGIYAATRALVDPKRSAGVSARQHSEILHSICFSPQKGVDAP